MKKLISPEELEKRKETNKKVLKFGCLPLIIIFGVFLYFNGGNSDTKQSTADKDMAYIQSKEFVKQSLNFPEEADFPFMPDQATEYQDETYKIVSSVDGKNGFGVKIKKTYFCTLQYLKGDPANKSSWKLLELTFQ